MRRPISTFGSELRRDVSDVLQLEGELALNIAQQIGHFAQEQKEHWRVAPVPRWPTKNTCAADITGTRGRKQVCARGSNTSRRHRSGPELRAGVCRAGRFLHHAPPTGGFAPPAEPTRRPRRQLERRWTERGSACRGSYLAGVCHHFYTSGIGQRPKEIPQGHRHSTRTMPPPTTFTHFIGDFRPSRRSSCGDQTRPRT